MAKASLIMLFLATILIFSSDVMMEQVGGPCTPQTGCICRVGVPECINGVCTCCFTPTCTVKQESIGRDRKVLTLQYSFN
ncbi:hypothetical protein P3S67_030243 [Capsicum chacoense]